MNTNAHKLRLGDFLNGRYRIVRVLSAGVLRQTFIVEDSWQCDNPQCVVKHLKPNGINSEQWKISRRLFEREAEILDRLSNHSQIPRLLDSFQDKRGFYFVQELIVGTLLNAELSLISYGNTRWTESLCVELLQDVLNILDFIHSQGVIHGNLKPNNLIRRRSDGRLVLIGFSAACLIDIFDWGNAHQKSTTVSLLGEIPIEQLCGYPRPNSDLYALGAIAIQALTGLSLAQLSTDPRTGKISWQQHASVSAALAFVLNHLVLQDYQKRYQSAKDALIVLKTLMMKSEEQDVNNEELPEGLVLESSIATADVKAFQGNWFKIPSLMTGIGIGAAACNTAAISFGLYSLLNAAPSNPSLDRLQRARVQYEAGNFKEAIALAKSIPRDSTVYPESVATMGQWRREWHTAATQFQAAERAFHEKRWRDVLEEARKAPNVRFWQRKIEPLVEQAQPHLETEAQQLLKQAYEHAAQKDFSNALALLKQIPSETLTGTQIQPKLAEYQEKQRIKAESLLQRAYNRASERDFRGALNYLSQIPSETSTYETAQIKMAEYSQKQHYKEEVERVVELAKAASDSQDRSFEPFTTEPFIRSSDSEDETSELNPGSQLQEINP
ncbi:MULTISPECIES: protein kinase domain-containing protein [unclassified Coleofasciculus]|uniref:protein kinase domain-containing protein n=1 Tax=unclassified Coleofasciculus TaxID=2692782 RepID=UPI00187FE54D|nr:MULTISPECIES: serine/threonine protein kinase [unclassified Coleofasciculus]MBE9128352.1 serine/threonine protein kinase [Coleofasciculus sp. LEGE 07081]MBE9151408.1 serine/threonine protein kinase [Coleofasciculus sp. LEGE 07092]